MTIIECEHQSIKIVDHTHQQATKRVLVAMELVGKLSKSFVVTGERRWNAGLLNLDVSDPTPFIRQLISYDIAFGGVDQSNPKPELHTAYATNPVGMGYAKSAGQALNGKMLAQTEAANMPIRDPKMVYQPMSFGPIGRNWWPRAGYAGTYDQDWLDNRCPLLPTNFDPRYFQGAPADQQIPQLNSGDQVRLLNLVHPSLCQQGQVSFALPDLSLQCTIHPRKSTKQTVEMRPDTLLIEPDLQRFSIVWKATYSLGSDPSSVSVVELGKRPRLHFGRMTIHDIPKPSPTQKDNS